MSFFKKKWFWISVVVVIAGGGFYFYNKNVNKGPFYETQVVQRETVRQTVDVTGQVTPDSRLDLAFKNGGLIKMINVKVGDSVSAGQIVASLDARDVQFSADRARAALANAQANLSVRAAGETKESIQITQASLDQAQASLTKTRNDLDIARVSVEDDYRIAQLAVDTAQKNFDNANTTNDQVIMNGFESLKTTLQSALGGLQSALTNGDAIIGVDNTSANDRYEYILGFSDSAAVARAKIRYVDARTAYRAAYDQIQVLGVAPTEEAVRSAALSDREALEKTQLFLDDVQRVLAASITNSSLTAADLAAKQSQIAADRATISSQLSIVNTAIQTVTNAQLAQATNADQLRNALATAKTNLTIADRNRTIRVKTAETNVILQQAAVSSAQAALSQKKAGPRSVDLAPLRAQVLDAQTAYVQATDRLKDLLITAPVAGIIAEVVPKAGEQAAPNAKIITLIGNAGYTIEALIPEADIAKVRVGQPATLTLDAYGDDVKFEGLVVAENPDQTKVQDAIYYKVKVIVSEQPGREIKPGMTANVTILTSEKEEVLFITNRAIREVEGQKTVRVLENNIAVIKVIEIGIRGDEGRVEVVSGVELGQQVVIGELTAQEYATQQRAAN